MLGRVGSTTISVWLSSTTVSSVYSRPLAHGTVHTHAHAHTLVLHMHPISDADMNTHLQPRLLGTHTHTAPKATVAIDLRLISTHNISINVPAGIRNNTCIACSV